MILISHFYNEEYLLKWWLPYHKNMFDHGVMIDYHSTDKSVDLIKEICPSWEIIKTNNQDFDAFKVEEEINNIEKIYAGFKLVLNTTEFLVPFIDLRAYLKDKNAIAITRATMVDHEPGVEPGNDLILSKNYGFIEYNGINGQWRFLHTYHTGNYEPGRHNLKGGSIDERPDPNQVIIYWYGFSPWNDQLIKRKLQIKDRVPESNRQIKAGFQHLWTREEMEEKRLEFLSKSQILLTDDLRSKYLSFRL